MQGQWKNENELNYKGLVLIQNISKYYKTIILKLPTLKKTSIASMQQENIMISMTIIIIIISGSKNIYSHTFGVSTLSSCETQINFIYLL